MEESKNKDKTSVIDILRAFIEIYDHYINYYKPPNFHVVDPPECGSDGIWRATVKCGDDLKGILMPPDFSKEVFWINQVWQYEEGLGWLLQDDNRINA